MRTCSILVLSALIFLSGCGTKNEGGAQQAGRDVGQAVTQFASGVSQGVDSNLEVAVELSPAAADLGISKTVAKQSTVSSEGKTISVYFLAQRAVSVSLTAKALNAEGLEIGRRKIDVEFTDDDAKYVQFTFDAQMDSQLVKKYVIDVKEAPAGGDHALPTG